MPKNNLKWFILIALAITWGSSFILIKRGLESGLTPYEVGALRIVFTSVFLLFIGWKELLKIKKHQIKYIILAGLLGNFFPIFLFSIAQTQISSSITSTINSFTPLNTMIIGSIMFGIQFTKNNKIGVFMGIIGCLLLVYAGADSNPSKNYFYAFYVLLATFCYASNINLVKKFLTDVSPMSITVGNFAFQLIPAIIILYFSEFSMHHIHVIPSSYSWLSSINPLVYVAILGVVGTGIANIYFYKLIQISTPLFASSVTYLIPIVAMFWSVLDNEGVSLLQLLGTTIILFGVYISNKK
jgi:drug/metabolite transporter (DMT)-like permease